VVFDNGDAVDSREESLREIVRETVSTLSDEELARMVRGARQKYTAYAHPGCSANAEPKREKKGEAKETSCISSK
jgi:hypothetical protein